MPERPCGPVHQRASARSLLSAGAAGPACRALGCEVLMATPDRFMATAARAGLPATPCDASGAPTHRPGCL